MTLELSQESLAWLFLWSLIMGFSAGMVYDMLKFRRKLIRLGEIFEIILISMEDLCFFALWSAAFCILLYTTVFGVVRIEAIFSQFLGFYLYRKTLGIPILRFLDALARALKKLFEKIAPKIRIHKTKKQRKRKDRHKNERTR